MSGRHRRDRDRQMREETVQAIRKATGLDDLSKLESITGWVCPDCGVEQAPPGQLTEHKDGCPAGKLEDDVSDADRLWFEEHPSETSRIRPARPMEAAGALEELPFGHAWYVEVTKIPHFGRSRRFFTRQVL